MPKRVLQFHTNRFAQWRSDNDIDGTSVHATITGDPLGIDIGQDAADILNGEALLPDHAAALDALAEARKLLEESRLMFHRGEYPGRHGDACHQLGLRVTTFLATSTPPTTDIPRAASAPGAGHD